MEYNVVNQRVVKRQLERIGCQVYVANHGLEAFEKVQGCKAHIKNFKSYEAHDISIILMDIEMPIMNGLIATQEIRKYQKTGAVTKHIPIIAITANTRQEQIQ